MTNFPHLTRQIEDLGLQLEGVAEILEGLGQEDLSDRVRAAAAIVNEVMRSVKQGATS